MSILNSDATQFLRRWRPRPRRPEPGQIRFDFMEGGREVQHVKRRVGRAPARKAPATQLSGPETKAAN